MQATRRTPATVRPVVLAALAAVAAGYSGCSRSPAAPKTSGRATRAESDFVVMGTEGRIIVYCGDEQRSREALSVGRARLDEIDRALSAHKTDSEVSAVNQRAGGEPVAVGESTARAIQAAKGAWRLTDGAFNPLVGSLVHLWRQSAAAQRLPADEELASVPELLDVDRIELTQRAGQHYCRLGRAGMRLDLGGLGKGWAADEAVAAIRQTPGVRAALVMLGGDGAAWSDPAWTRPWVFGVQDPRKPETRDVLAPLRALNAAVITSGNYYRYYEIGGRRYSHILDPRTGRPVETDVVSATVIDHDGGRADALATACMVLGTQAAIELLERVQGAEALILENSDTGLLWHQTSGFARYEAAR
jgi:thiamine biosynthesis lipoprotein